MLHKVKTVNGHKLTEVVSALQKAIRRGDVDGALYWATDMCLTGYAEYCWKRLRIITSEDVGLADLDMPIRIQALYQMWVDLKKKKDVYQEPERLFLVHAVMLLATARKNRMVDDALVSHWGWHQTDRHKRSEIPDHALDRHTQRGKTMGRGVDHVFEVGYHLEGEVEADQLLPVHLHELEATYRSQAYAFEKAVEDKKMPAKAKPDDPAQASFLDEGGA